MKSRAVGILVMALVVIVAVFCITGFKGKPKEVYLEDMQGETLPGNVKKCAVGKHPKSEKLGSTGQAACCARIHSRYFTGGNPSGLRV